MAKGIVEIIINLNAVLLWKYIQCSVSWDSNRKEMIPKDEVSSKCFQKREFQKKKAASI